MQDIVLLSVLFTLTFTLEIYTYLMRYILFLLRFHLFMLNGETDVDLKFNEPS